MGGAFRCIAAGAAALVVASCGQSFPIGPEARTQAPQDTVLGSGDVTVALLLPMSAGGNPGQAAAAMRNAAELALSEVSDPAIRILPLDTAGTAEGAQAAAQRALAANARLIVGPLLSQSVQAAGQVAKPAGVPVIAFSTDANVAASGVYLLSFLPEAEVERVVSYTARSGKRSFAALLPEGAYGSIVEAALRQAAPRHGGRVVAISRYADASNPAAAAAQLATVAGGASPQADAVLVPEGAGVLSRVLPALRAAGVSPDRVQLVGSGQWNDPAVWRLDAAQGGWFAAANPAGFQGFSDKYQGRFGSEPPRIASLAYDAVSLAAALGRIGGQDGFSREVLTNADGFAGTDGVFRFKSNGLNERGLAILEIRDGTAVVRDPAPGAFGG